MGKASQYYHQYDKAKAKEMLEKELADVVEKQGKAVEKDDHAAISRYESEKLELQVELQALQTYP